MPAFAAEQEGDRVAEIDWVAQSKEARHPRHQAIPSYLVNSSCQTKASHPRGMANKTFNQQDPPTAHHRQPDPALSVATSGLALPMAILVPALPAATLPRAGARGHLGSSGEPVAILAQAGARSHFGSSGHRFSRFSSIFRKARAPF